MPIAAVAGAMAGTAIMLLFLWFGMKLHGGFSEDGWYFRYVMPVISSAIFGYLYTYISCTIAPRGKVIAGTVMATILGLFCLVSVLLAWFMPQYPVGKAVQSTVGAVATMIASVATLITVSQEQ